MSELPESLSRMLAEAEAKRQRDADTFLLLDRDECMLCGAYGADKRSLFIDCGYAVHEVIPEVLDIRNVGNERGKAYYLLICKSCRGQMLRALQGWADERRALRNSPKDHDGDLLHSDPERNIPVRVNGATEMWTREEWDARQNA